MKPPKKIVAAKQQFLNEWIAEIPLRIEELKRMVSQEVRDSLDFSPASLEVVGQMAYETFENPEDYLAETPRGGVEAKKLGMCVGAYAKETFLRNLPGSRYGIVLDDTRMIGFGSPKIFGPDEYPFAELPLVYGLLVRKNPMLFRTYLERLLREWPKEFRGKPRPLRICSERLKSEWLDEVQEAVDYFLNWLAPDLSTQFDFSLESLDAVEEYVRSVCKVHNEFSIGHYPQITDGASRYIGEVFRRHLGGHWDVELGKPLDTYYELPAIVGERGSKYRFCPLRAIGRSLLMEQAMRLRADHFNKCQQEVERDRAKAAAKPAPAPKPARAKTASVVENPVLQEVSDLQGKLTVLGLGKIRQYFTYEHGRARDPLGISVLNPFPVTHNILSPVRQLLPAGTVAFFGTNRKEIVIGRGESQFDMLRLARTEAPNYNLDTEDIIEKLEEFHQEFGISIWLAETDAVQLNLFKYPADLLEFTRRVEEFCPDTVHQGSGSTEKLAEEMEITMHLRLWWD